MSTYEEEKFQVNKWINMIDEYILEPNSIDPQWVECLIYCKKTMKNQLLQRAKFQYKIINLMLQDFYLQTKDVLGHSDYLQHNKYQEDIDVAEREYSTLYGTLPNYETVEDLTTAFEQFKKEIQGE